MCSDVNEAALDFGDARRLALGLRFGQELRAFGIRLEDDIEQALGAVGRFLGEPADAIAGRDLTCPCSGVISPAMMRKSVVLPVPLRPTSPTWAPAGSATVAWSSRVRSPIR